MCSDHFNPWSTTQGESAHAWTWLGAALSSTSLPFGVVNAPGYRYHPAIIAQAAATLSSMFPERFWFAVGSGQLLNESITGENWPVKDSRNTRLLQCVQIMRALWAGETVTSHGHVTVENAKLWTRPAKPPLLIAAALTPQTAEWAAGWADGLITISKPREKLAKVVEAWQRGGGKKKPMFLQVKLSWADSNDEALENAWKEWRYAVSESLVQTNLPTPEAMEASAAFVKEDDMRQHIRISSHTKDHAEQLLEDIDMGFERLFLHNVGRNQIKFIHKFGEDVLPLIAGVNRGEIDRV